MNPNDFIAMGVLIGMFIPLVSLVIYVAPLGMGMHFDSPTRWTKARVLLSLIPGYLWGEVLWRFALWAWRTFRSLP